jgi:hypothetical protein
MIHTALLEAILEGANAVKNASNCEYLCASHIAVAVAEFCGRTYTGLDFSTFCYPRFEEERLRYLFSKEVKLAAYFRLRLSQNIKNGIPEEEFDLSCCEHIASLRGAPLLSSDVVFLCTLTKLHGSYKGAVRTAISDEAVIALLQDADANIYDYVIKRIDDIRSVLKKKADEAAAIRDWKPATKFAEPEALAAMFFEKIKKNVSKTVLTLRFPRFFGTTDLKVSIHQAGDVYYIHDNGCTIRHLSKQVADQQKRDRIIKKVCHSCWIDKGRITGRFCRSFSFLYYLQSLVFIAHADLYYTKTEKPVYHRDKAYFYVDADQADPLDAAALLDELKNSIHFDYDENKGLYYWLDTNYSFSSGRASFLVETLERKRIRISDKNRGKIEGEIFEAFYWDNDDISPYSKFLSKITARFGAEFDGRDVFLSDKAENLFPAMVKFFNLAVLLSEFGHDIAVRKR